jgi:hypothetical protein
MKMDLLIGKILWKMKKNSLVKKIELRLLTKLKLKLFKADNHNNTFPLIGEVSTMYDRINNEINKRKNEQNIIC